MCQNDLKSPNFFLIYCTANEGNFLDDYENFFQMVKRDPGVSSIKVFLVISQVLLQSSSQKKFISSIQALTDTCEWLQLDLIITKGNIGRDFSSIKVGLDAVSRIAKFNDLVMIRNRSAKGPFAEGWFSRFQTLLGSHQNIGLVGNTINLYHHEKIMKGSFSPHVQTYVFVSYFHILENYRNDFPATNLTDRFQIIAQGEIGLSKKIMNDGYYLTCLLWPQKLFRSNEMPDPTSPKVDIKMRLKKFVFLHRKGLSIWRVWIVRLVTALKLLKLKTEAKSTPDILISDQYYA